MDLNETPKAARVVVAIAADLMFAARMRSTAEAVGSQLHLGRTAADVIRLSRDLGPALIIVDLDTRSLDPVELIRQLKSEPQTSGVRVLSYVSHVREDLISAAREAGAEVIARGAFHRNLPSILSP